MGTFCGGLDNFTKDQDPVPVVPEIANVSLIYGDEEFWESEPTPLQERDIELQSPSLDTFLEVVNKVYSKISYHATLTTTALKEIKAWEESLNTREAQQNVCRLEKDTEHPMEALDPNEESDLTTTRKLGWVDRIMARKGMRKRKGKDCQDNTHSDHMEELKKKVTGENAPEKFQVKRKEKPMSFQATFEAQAVEALQGMLEAVSDRPPSTIPTGTQISINEGTTAPKPGPGLKRPRKPRTRKAANVEDTTGSEPGTGGTPKNPSAEKENVSQITSTRKPRQRKSRAAPPISKDAVKEHILQSSVLKTPLTPLQENVISNIRFGSAQAWAMSPNFPDILQAFSEGATKKKEQDEVIILT
ncbi:unnamed protein product [Calypogeia fissa]